jgi:Sugar kinases, ribokinase family
MCEVVTLGECMALLYPQEPISLEQATTLTMDIAGAEANLAIGMSRLGHRVRFMSRVGNDPFGQRIRSTLATEGVDTSALLTDPVASTGVYFREWLPDGVRRVFYYRSGSAASQMGPSDLSSTAFAGARILHLTGITPALSSSCAALVIQAIELAHAVGMLVSFDPNYRPRLWDKPTAQQALLPLLARSDMVLMGHEDAQALFGLGEDEQILQRVADLGVGVVVLKRAERGAWALAGGRSIIIAAEAAKRVVDPVGAGDGFDAGFLSGWLRGYPLEMALRLGARVGAEAVAQVGDYLGYPRV